MLDVGSYDALPCQPRSGRCRSRRFLSSVVSVVFSEASQGLDGAYQVIYMKRLNVAYRPDYAHIQVSTPAAGEGEHGPGGGHDSDGPDLTTDDLVAFSSRLIAAARAAESLRADRLFHDPYAELLVRNCGCCTV